MSTLDHYLTKNQNHKCKFCDKEFKSEKALKIHTSKQHFLKIDESIEIKDQGSHVVIEITLQKPLFEEFRNTVKRSGVDLEQFFSHVFTIGDALTDQEIQQYHLSKIMNKTEAKVEVTYIG